MDNMIIYWHFMCWDESIICPYLIRSGGKWHFKEVVNIDYTCNT